jgi:hypothetical protein
MALITLGAYPAKVLGEIRISGSEPQRLFWRRSRVQRIYAECQSRKRSARRNGANKVYGHETAGGVADGRGLAAALIESVAANGVLRRR